MVIQRILRHANVSTTATYYIKTAAADLPGRFGGQNYGASYEERVRWDRACQLSQEEATRGETTCSVETQTDCIKNDFDDLIRANLPAVLRIIPPEKTTQRRPAMDTARSSTRIHRTGSVSGRNGAENGGVDYFNARCMPFPSFSKSTCKMVRWPLEKLPEIVADWS
jgi:hypothetical protein